MFVILVLIHYPKNGFLKRWLILCGGGIPKSTRLDRGTAKAKILKGKNQIISRGPYHSNLDQVTQSSLIFKLLQFSFICYLTFLPSSNQADKFHGGGGGGRLGTN